MNDWLYHLHCTGIAIEDHGVFWPQQDRLGRRCVLLAE